MQCHWCGEEVQDFPFRYASAKTDDGQVFHFHVSVAPLGKQCYNEWLQQQVDEAKAAIRKHYDNKYKK